MTLVLIGKDLVLEGPRPNIEDKQVPGNWHILICHDWVLFHLLEQGKIKFS